MNECDEWFKSVAIGTSGARMKAKGTRASRVKNRKSTGVIITGADAESLKELKTPAISTTPTAQPTDEMQPNSVTDEMQLKSVEPPIRIDTLGEMPTKTDERSLSPSIVTTPGGMPSKSDESSSSILTAAAKKPFDSAIENTEDDDDARIDPEYKLHHH